MKVFVVCKGIQSILTFQIQYEFPLVQDSVAVVKEDQYFCLSTDNEGHHILLYPWSRFFIHKAVIKTVVMRSSSRKVMTYEIMT